MVVKIKKITFIILNTGFKKYNQALVKVYDTCNNLIYIEETYNGRLDLLLKEKNVYKVEIIKNSSIIKSSIYVVKDKYIFSFSRTITFLLRDANYYNLPIKKGEIILWQK